LPDDVPAPFNQYCVATFTEDYEPPYDFSIQAGESYLYIDATFLDEHEMIYFHEDLGPVTFTIESPEPLPFTSNCDPLESGTSYYAVLADVTIYNDEALSDPACELAAGTIVEPEGGSGFMHVAEVDGGNVYQYIFLSPLCPGVEDGYVFVPSVLFFGANAQSFPIHRIKGP
jgi:hypothetical protein